MIAGNRIPARAARFRSGPPTRCRTPLSHRAPENHAEALDAVLDEFFTADLAGIRVVVDFAPYRVSDDGGQFVASIQQRALDLDDL